MLAAGSATPLLEAEGPAAPLGRAFESWWFDEPRRLSGSTASSSGPRARARTRSILRVHGGPHSADLDRWAPDLQAHVDAGFLVAMVNYRGSVGFGQAWRDALKENVGFLELEDVLAGLDDLVGRGLADPARVVLAGLVVGRLRDAARHRPAPGPVRVRDRRRAGRRLRRRVRGREPDPPGDGPVAVRRLARRTLPELYRERNPIEYAAAVRVPLLILAGENDTRCPIRQVWNYVDRLRTGGVEPEVYTYATGHSSFDVEERVRQTAIVLDFLARTVPGATRLEGLDAHLAAAGVATPA